MEGWKRWVPLVGLLALTGFFTFAFFYTHDRELKEVEVGPSGLALVNDYLAAERTLDALGVPTDSTFGLVELPPYDHLVVVLDTNAVMREPIADELLDWADYGGTLVHVRPDEPDTLLRTAGWAPAESPWGQAQSYGAGTLVLMESGRWMDNEHLAEGDNVQRLWSQARRHPGVHLVIRGERPGVFTLLWRHAWTLCLSALVLGLAWLKAVSGRFGPLLPDPVPVRRSLLEHVDGAGRFLWRHGRHERLVESTRRAVLRRLEVHLPGLEQLDPERQHQLIGQHVGMPADEVGHALAGPARTRRQFTRAVQKLQTMWSAL